VGDVVGNSVGLEGVGSFVGRLVTGFLVGDSIG
jgi:hypothetical protein